MSGICAKNLHPLCAVVAYAIVTSLVFAGLFSSSFSMYSYVAFPDCMSGTTSKLYPSGPFNKPYVAPSATSVPFCTKDAVNNAVKVGYTALGYLGISQGTTDLFTASSSLSSIPYCFKKSNATCPNFEDEGLTSITVRYTSGVSLPFQFVDTKNRALNGGVAGLNNVPVKFSPANVPAGVDSSKVYYLRDFVGSFGFNIADSTSSPPLKLSAPASTATITVTLQQFGKCPSQTNVQMPSNPSQDSNVNEDGTYKTGSCGYCLTQPLMTGWLAVPGLCGTTIALLLILEIMMMIPALRKRELFRILFIIVSVICLIFLIAAVGAGATMFMETAKCAMLTDLSQAQIMPSPFDKSFDGFTPSRGGVPLPSSDGKGNYQTTQNGQAAAYYKPFLVPSIGAVELIVAIVLLFVFTIVFAIKTDWAAVTSSGGDSSVTMVAPH